MKVVLVGASKAAVALISRLQHADNSAAVVLVDTDREKLERISENHDIGMVIGDGTAPKILEEAYGDNKPDLLVALTDSDQVNLIAAAVGKALGAKTALPQITSPQLVHAAKVLGMENWIAPEALIAHEIEKHINVDLDSDDAAAADDE